MMWVNNRHGSRLFLGIDIESQLQLLPASLKLLLKNLKWKRSKTDNSLKFAAIDQATINPISRYHMSPVLVDTGVPNLFRS